MEDFEKLITDYLDNKRFNKEEDLKKLKEKGLKQRNIFNRKLVYSFATIVLVCVIALSIILPNINKNASRIVYFDDSQIEYTEISEYNDLLELMDNKTLIPKIEAISYYNKSITAIKDNRQVGIYSVLTINTMEYISVYMYSVYANFVLSSVNIYDFVENVIWGDYNIKYRITNNGVINSYEFSFTHNGIYHYYKVESVTNYEITTLMNSLFS